MSDVSLIQFATIASPCSAPWEEMSGDDRVRHCAKCDLDVYNIAEMTEDEANTLLAEATGRVCGRLFRRPDGTVLTRDCPIGLRARARRRTVRTIAKVAACLAVLAAGMGVVRARHRSNASMWRMTEDRTVDTIGRWLGTPPPPRGMMIAGDMCVRPVPVPTGAPAQDGEG